MRIFIPQSPLTILDSNVAPSALPAWSLLTTYAAAAKVRYQADGSQITREYESVQGGNTGHTPAEGGDAWWLDLGPQNRDEMFDGRNNTRTVTDEGDPGIIVRIRPPGVARYLCLMGLRNVSQVVVTQYADSAATTPLSGPTTYGLLRATTPVGWWTWLFGTHWNRKSLIVPLPGPYYRPVIEITIKAEQAECGQCFVCNMEEFGCAADGASPTLTSYSTFAADEFGTVKYVARQNTRELNLTTWVSTDDFDRLYLLMEQHEASLLLIDANHADAPDATDYDALRVYGKITLFRPGLQYDRTPIELRIQGLD